MKQHELSFIVIYGPFIGYTPVIKIGDFISVVNAVKFECQENKAVSSANKRR